MAFSTTNVKKLNCVRIISKKDPAIDWKATTEEAWKNYESNPIKNEALLKFKPNEAPTVFICNFELTGRERAMAKDAMVKGIDEDKNVQVSYGKWAYTLVRMVLKDIETPANVKDGLVLKKDSKSYVSDETMSFLEKFGISTEIFNHYMTLAESDEVLSETKN